MDPSQPGDRAHELGFIRLAIHRLADDAVGDLELMPAKYVKAYVKRNKNDAADAEAICEAVTRPTMRFVPIKTPDQQALLESFRA